MRAAFSALVLASLCLITLPAAARVVAVPAQKPARPQAVACTMEAKMCPDGKTYVSRHGPNCAFAPCPDDAGAPAPVPPPDESATPEKDPEKDAPKEDNGDPDGDAPDAGAH